MGSSGITTVITTVGAPRRRMLARALESVWTQALEPDAVIIAQDNDRLGAPRNRQSGTDCVETQFVAYLDDDDELLPQHLAVLARTQQETGADLVFPWFEVAGGYDPFPQYCGAPWDNAHLRQVPVTFLARVGAIRDVGGWLTDWTTVAASEDPGTDADGNRAGEDYQLVKRLVAAGASIVHHPERTWVWHHDSGNTMGLPSRVDWNRVEW